jgi:ammonium transporter, Amt family
VLVDNYQVFLMTPGLAFFCSAMVNSKNALSTMMKSVIAVGLVGLQIKNNLRLRQLR